MGTPRKKGKLGPATEEGRARALANLKPAKPGEVRNPKGRGTAGASVLEWWNVLAEQEPSEEELRSIARDKRQIWQKRTAALRMLRTLEGGDLADFEDLLKGRKTLGELRADGVNTEVVKRLKQKSRVVPIGNDETEEVIEREIELHDRAGADVDRILDRTEGRPKQSVEMNANVLLRTPDDRAAEATQAADRLRSILNPSRN